ncbi:ABC transporter permease [Aureimonas sp. ME7]|uniref:ABC transporter permease n=1 Tax=Aureimonas sp. ME7 TaxID=2744252 RepID=UPI0015F6A995|nr:ABC transporter permease [Aureimonas sp. ME7]
MTISPSASASPGPATGWSLQADKVGLPIGLGIALALWVLPFATLKANRIVAGEAHGFLDALPPGSGMMLLLAILATAAAFAFRLPSTLRLIGALAGTAGLCLAIGLAPDHLAPSDNPYARVSPASGFWTAFFLMTLALADALTRKRPGPAFRLALLAGVGALSLLFLGTGFFDGLSVMKEFAARADTFWAEGARHLSLAFGSMGIAIAIGIPFAILAERWPVLRGPVLNALNIVQTVPSIALFGLLIAPLGWIALHVPGAAAIGVRGIGIAPALVALTLYSLLPVVGNTLAGFAGVSPAAKDAATGIGMTRRQRLLRVELPLALPVILVGIRIVLVQNIGLATIAALIGGGGFGVFVFQGLGQNATDLVLLGALPTVILAFATAVVLDAAIEVSSPAKGRLAS